MPDKFDYPEPPCPLCGGRELYHPQPNTPLGRIPIARILGKADALFARNDCRQAGQLLEYWLQEAVSLADPQGELAICSELVGYYRKQDDPEKGIPCIFRALELVRALGQDTLASGATVFINCATAYHAFALPEEAMPLYRQAQQIYHRVLPDADARFGGLYNNMALSLVSLGQYREAAQAYASALAVMEQIPGGEAECAITWINLAYLWESQGQSREAGWCMDQAYILLQSGNPPQDGHLAFVLEKCAPAFRDFGSPQRYAELKHRSEELYARS